ncbi:hypothetical protein F4680DRAFT_452516 [Xylaria scruposa]|nr:hypothetical protein F4680DRAFT_452516 [Xylaria scruposa]
MKLLLNRSAIFNERFTGLLVHPAWSDKLHYLLMALGFTSICASDDRRYLGVICVGKNAFFDTWELCQAKYPDKPKNAILDDVEESLKAQGIWPCTICQVLQAIAKRAHLRQASTTTADKEDDENEEESDGENSAQQQSLRAMSANYLLRIQSALDGMTDGKGIPPFPKTKDCYHLFSASRNGGTYKSSDYPASEGYPELLKQARIGLVYDAYAYKTAWENENAIFSYVQNDVEMPPAKTAPQSLSRLEDREALDEDQSSPSQRRGCDSTNSNTSIRQRKRPRDMLAEKDASGRPKRAACHLHPALTSRGAPSTPVNEGPRSFSEKTLSRATIKTEEQVNTSASAVARTNSMIPIASPITYAGSHPGPRRVGLRDEVAEYENVHSSRIDMIRRSDQETRAIPNQWAFKWKQASSTSNQAFMKTMLRELGLLHEPITGIFKGQWKTMREKAEYRAIPGDYSYDEDW